MPWIASLLDWLNRYANLLLAVITAVYVYLTWKTLKALERSSLRERESQHLTDIKSQVVSPILQWLELTAQTLRGRQDPVIIMTALGNEPSLQAPRQLYPAVLRIEGLSNDLYEHAMHDHFAMLHKYQAFRALVEQLFGSIAKFGNKCCIDIQKLTSLPPFAGDHGQNNVNCEGVVQFWLRTNIGGIDQDFYVHDDHVGLTIVNTPYSSEVIVRGPDKEVRQLLDDSKSLIEKSWHAARLRERIQRTLEDADKLRDAIRQVELTYSLMPCKYTRD